MAATSPRSKPKLKLTFSKDLPFQVHFESPAELKRFEKRQQQSKIRAGMLRYLSRIQELTELQVPEPLRPALPYHFHSLCRALVSITANGIAIRYEPTTAIENEVVVLETSQTLAEIVPGISLGLVRVVESENEEPPPLPVGLSPPTVTLETRDEKGDRATVLIDAARFQIIFALRKARSASQESISSPPASIIRNQFEIGIEGIENPDSSDPTKGGRSFRTRGKMSFPLFWDAIGIYPDANRKEWRKADFYSWAERHFYEIAFHTASTEYSWAATASQAKIREHYRDVLAQLDGLLSLDDVLEEQLQQLISRHPEILVPGYKRVIPKQPLGPHVTDYVIEDPTGQYLLVELENPSQPLFTKSGHASAKLTHAKGQVTDWVRYIQDNKSTVERELGLAGISAQPLALIVIGRSSSLSAEHRRKLQVDEGKVEIITYDDLRLRFVKTIENLMGMLGHANSEIAYFPSQLTPTA